jgi:hypothetical protein
MLHIHRGNHAFPAIKSCFVSNEPKDQFELLNRREVCNVLNEAKRLNDLNVWNAPQLVSAAIERLGQLEPSGSYKPRAYLIKRAAVPGPA